MTAPTGNPQALRAHKAQSHARTRLALEEALSRLRNGHPLVVKRGSRITAALVAQEAGVDRSTLYRYHEPILTAIRRLNETTPRAQLQAKHSALTAMKVRLREYQALAETAQTEVMALARLNYGLDRRVKELEALLRQRDEMIKDIEQRLSAEGASIPRR